MQNINLKIKVTFKNREVRYYIHTLTKKNETYDSFMKKLENDILDAIDKSNLVTLRFKDEDGMDEIIVAKEILTIACKVID